MRSVESPFPSQDEFRFWLKLSFAPKMVVADDWNCGTCPLARFLYAQGFDDPVVYGNAGGWSAGPFPLNEERRRRPMPDWVKEFVYWADRTKPREVTAEECLFIMDQPFFKPEAWDNGKRQIFIS